MLIKILEIRDSGTFIPVLAVLMDEPANEAQRYYLRRCGYPLDGYPNVAITSLHADGDPFWNDPYGWRSGARTYPVAHNYIIKHWAELKDGDVICVEFILGERPEPKVSERAALGEAKDE
jgi:hypothetical protein